MTESHRIHQISLEDLEKEEAQLRKIIAERKEEQRKQTIAYIRKIIEESELDMRDVVAELSTAVKRRKAPAKYRNPENPRQTWSGKGAPPQWFIDAPDKEAIKIANEKKRKK